MRRILIKILIWLVIVVLLLVGAIVAGTILLKDRLIAYGIEAINNELNAPVQVDGIHFSLINTFPYASIVLENVTVKSPEQGFRRGGFRHATADTLLTVRKLSLSFNIRKLLDNELELNSVKVTDGRIYILVDNRGNDNFHIIKQKTEKAGGMPMQIKLEHLGINDCMIQVCNLYKDNGIEWYMPDFEAEGKLVGDRYQISTKGAIALQWFVANGIEIVPLAPTRIKMDLTATNDTLLIRKGQLSSKGINIGVAGTVRMGKETFVVPISGTRRMTQVRSKRWRSSRTAWSGWRTSAWQHATASTAFQPCTARSSRTLSSTTITSSRRISSPT